MAKAKCNFALSIGEYTVPSKFRAERMPSAKRAVENAKAECKDMIHESANRNGFTQEQIADAIGHSQPTVHRWLEYGNEATPWIHTIPFFPEALRLDIIRDVANRCGGTFILQIETGKLNATISDECLDLVTDEGKLIEEFKRRNHSTTRMMQILNQIEQTIAKTKAEVERMP